MSPRRRPPYCQHAPGDPLGAGEELLVVAHGFDSDMIAGLRVGADQLGRVANARGFRSDLPAFGGY
jgi:hypothetical protein